MYRLDLDHLFLLVHIFRIYLLMFCQINIDNCFVDDMVDCFLLSFISKADVL